MDAGKGAEAFSEDFLWPINNKSDNLNNRLVKAFLRLEKSNMHNSIFSLQYGNSAIFFVFSMLRYINWYLNLLILYWYEDYLGTNVHYPQEYLENDIFQFYYLFDLLVLDLDICY